MRVVRKEARLEWTDAKTTQEAPRPCPGEGGDPAPSPAVLLPPPYGQCPLTGLSEQPHGATLSLDELDAVAGSLCERLNMAPGRISYFYRSRPRAAPDGTFASPRHSARRHARAFASLGYLPSPVNLSVGAQEVLWCSDVLPKSSHRQDDR